MEIEKAKSLTCPLLKQLCVADKCMAWKFLNIYSKGIGFSPPLIIGKSTTRGYCSLVK